VTECCHRADGARGGKRRGRSWEGEVGRREGERMGGVMVDRKRRVGCGGLTAGGK